MTPQALADQIYNDAINTLADRARSLPPNHRATLRRAANALARIAIRRINPAAQPPDPSPEALAHEELAARAILANLRATGHMLAANALRDALATSLRTAASAIARL